MTTSIPLHTIVPVSLNRNCDICGKEARITVNQDHFCGECMRTKRVRAFFIGRASR